jgi:hypothetical protein
MAKLFGTEALVRHSEDLAELVKRTPSAAISIRRRWRAARSSVLRLAIGTAIYAGTSEIPAQHHRPARVRLPRSATAPLGFYI